MKILKIAFKNINSLRGSHEIDFTKEPFKTNALFAITGPTGSGKSTLLDVIALALFNQVPRLGRITKNEILSKGAILTRNQKEAMAAVTYSCKSGSFVSTWSISTNRNDNLRDYEMDLSNVDNGVLFDLKKSDVPAKNEELIGLNYNQFIKSVLLAQGEFAQFLQAKKDERGALLEKITGTGIYRRLGQLAFEKYKLENQTIKTQQETIAIKSGELLPPELAEKYQNELAQYHKAIEPLSQEIENIQKKITIKETISRQEKDIEAAQKLKEQEKQNLLFFEENEGNLLKNHEKTEPLAPQVTQWDQQRERKAELQLEEKQNTAHAQKLDERKKLLKTEIFNLIKQETAPQYIVESLQNFAAKVGKLQQERQEKRNTLTALREQLKSLISSTDFSLGNSVENDVLELKNRLKQSENSLKTLKNDLQEVDLQQIEGEKRRLRETLKALNSALSLQEKKDSVAANFEKTKAEQDLINKQQENLPREIELATANKERYYSEQQKLKAQQHNELLHASLTEHREHLKNGKPCPLCGALEHPFAIKLPAPAQNLEKALADAEQLYTQWNNKNIQLQTQLERTREDHLKLQTAAREQQKELENLETSLKQQVTDLKLGAPSAWQLKNTNFEHQLENLEIYENEKRYHDALAEGFPLLIKMQETIVDGKKLTDAIDALYRGNDIYKDVQALQNRWISFEENEKNIKGKIQEIQQKLTKTRENLEKTALKLLPQINKIGFETIENAKAALLDHDTYTRLRRQRELLTQRITNQEATLKTLENQVLKNKENDVSQQLVDLQEDLKKSKEKLDNLRNSCEDLNRQLKNNAERQEAIAQLQKKINEKENEIKRWRLLNELIGDANGKKFNEFAQHLTLTQLLRLANTRLKDLSDRYLLDTPQAEEDDSLVAIDEHMGGQRRSVKTLSGGETFILSLSMALALSDLASRNVEINSLFIDEGFGTLDPETLDQTLDTLERLQAASSKTIGIISHVDSLKERIATQIQLSRNGQGYSSLKII